MIRDYLSLAKPRMVEGNLMVAVAAFIFGSGASIDWVSFGWMSLGLALVIASGCVFNNYFDRDIDARMERTKGRALAAGRMPQYRALLFGLVLIAAGLGALSSIEPLALYAAIAGFVSYVFLYTPLKHKHGYALYIGAFAGATPPVVGYAAAAHALDIYALGLFLFLFLWQLPHFIAIAIYRFDEYTAAGIPLLVGNHSAQNRARARKIFHYSLVVLLLFCAGLILQRWTR